MKIKYLTIGELFVLVGLYALKVCAIALGYPYAVLSINDDIKDIRQNADKREWRASA
jgi:hypothetical protein